MKRHLLLLGALAIALAGNAQRSSIGITGGGGFSWMSNTGHNLDKHASYNGGLTYVYSSETHWGLGVDVKYSREGAKYEYPGVLGGILSNVTNKTYSYTSDADYIRVPLRAIYFFNKYDKAVRPNISLGPSFGFLTGGTISNSQNNNKDNVTDYYKKFDFGLQATAGASFRLATALWLTADIAYYQGLIKQNINGSNNMMNGNLVLNLGLRIGI